ERPDAGRPADPPASDAPVDVRAHVVLRVAGLPGGDLPGADPRDADDPHAADATQLRCRGDPRAGARRRRGADRRGCGCLRLEPVGGRAAGRRRSRGSVGGRRPGGRRPGGPTPGAAGLSSRLRPAARRAQEGDRLHQRRRSHGLPALRGGGRPGARWQGAHGAALLRRHLPRAGPRHVGRPDHRPAAGGPGAARDAVAEGPQRRRGPQQLVPHHRRTGRPGCGDLRLREQRVRRGRLRGCRPRGPHRQPRRLV
ncbi:MAG: hypothetical protein AVDCRST_MAG47-2522, partial [uncultured Nocardioidaceae bacterium]